MANRRAKRTKIWDSESYSAPNWAPKVPVPSIYMEGTGTFGA